MPCISSIPKLPVQRGSLVPAFLLCIFITIINLDVESWLMAKGHFSIAKTSDNSAAIEQGSSILNRFYRECMPDDSLHTMKEIAITIFIDKGH